MNLSISLRRSLVGAMALCLISACNTGNKVAAEQATLVLHNGTIATVDKNQPEVQALAVKGDRILALGTNAQIKAYIGDNTEVIDLEGRFAMPGFIEGHGHFMGIGYAKMILDLRTQATWDEIVAKVAEAVAAAQPGERIEGRGWHQDKWTLPPSPAVEGFPTLEGLSLVSPNHPVVLTHASGHASFVNAKALELAGIGPDTPNPQGGEILRDKNGKATGLLRETAQGLTRSVGRDQSEEQRRAAEQKMARLASQECLSKGITSFQDAGSGFKTVDLFKELADEGKLGVRLWVMIRGSNEDLEANLTAYRSIGYGNNHLTVRAIKVSIDGALGSRGAWLLDPYSDAPELSGLNLVPLDSVRRTAELAMQHDYQLGIHAIGDRGNREVLDIYQQAFEANPDKKDPRWRVEHAQHLNPSEIPRFGSMGVIASMQAVHCTSDGTWVPDRLGKQRSEEGAYVWQKLIQAGAVVTNGTDAPVEDVSPLASFYSGVSRKLSDGSVFYPDQRMSRIQALESYTINCAYAAFEEDLKGSLIVGKLADMVILSKNILTVPEDEIPSTEVLTTIVGGKVVYRKGE